MAAHLKRPASAAAIIERDPSADFEVLEKIGQGSFGVIRKVRKKTTGEILARKEISYRSMSQRERDQLHAEIKVLERLQHQNIVRYVSRHHIKSSNDLHLYMEYCSSGDLGGYIKKLTKSNRFADEDFVWSVFAQLVGALYRCHAGEDTPAPGHEADIQKTNIATALRRKDEQQIILHRDLKPENVFLTNGSTVKLGDFGLSKLISAHDFASTYVGTPFYMSPEICSSERYSGKSDIWSLGCIIYELCALEPPFNARSHLELIQKIRIGRTKPLPQHFSKELSQVISSCLRINPDERPDTMQLLQVNGIRVARLQLSKVDEEMSLSRACKERDTLASRLEKSEKANAALEEQIRGLRDEMTKLQSSQQHVEMALYAKAQLNIAAQVDAQVTHLKGVFEAEVEKRTEAKLAAHLASLPAASGVSVSVRSSTPPPETKYSSFTTTTTTTAPTTASSPATRSQDEADIDTDFTSLSLGDDTSPLALRVKPVMRKSRTLFMRAKTVANIYPASPMDVQMADPSPMPAPASHLRGLALSPRREHSAKDRLLGQAVRRNIFAEAAALKPPRTFADDLSEEDEPTSPSRPTSSLSNGATKHSRDPFKALDEPLRMPPPTRRARPSLERQQTMPVTMPQASNLRRNTMGLRDNTAIPALPKSTTVSNLLLQHESSKENRPPSSHGRTHTVPVVAASPKRAQAPRKELTPNRQAPRPPNKTPNLVKAAIKGRSLVELSQAPSPVKWDLEVLKGEVEMPSPFLARKGRTFV
ncbi:G2-specific serine/threonine protein kinase [Oleoguttula sp. CCFEE 5521]